MKPTRWDRNLKRASIAALTGFCLLALQTSALGQQKETTDTSAAAPQTPAAPADTAAPAPTPPTGEAEPAPSPAPGTQAIPAPPRSPAAQPGYGPPPGVPYHYYGYPNYGYPSYSGYRVAPSRPVTYRPFMFGVGLGMGSLAYSSTSVSKHEAAMSYSVHVGFSITARWMALLAMDGSWAQFTFKDFTSDPSLLYGKLSVALTSYTAGAQFFMLRWLYARVGLGLACLEWSDDFGDWSDCRGQAASGAVGAEFLQTHSTALAAEFGGFVTRFPDARTISDRNDVWYHLGVNLVLNLY